MKKSIKSVGLVDKSFSMPDGPPGGLRSLSQDCIMQVKALNALTTLSGSLMFLTLSFEAKTLYSYIIISNESFSSLSISLVALSN